MKRPFPENEEKLNIGIDLGTTYCSISFWDPIRKQPVLLGISDYDTAEEYYIPSWVSLDRLKTDGTIVGKEAKKSIESESIVYDCKRLIGRNFVNISKDDREKWIFKVKEDNGVYIELYNPRTLDYERFEPEEISGLLLNFMIDIFQRRRPMNEIGTTVVTIPANFDLKQKEATMNACKLAGLKDVHLLEEPTAAFFEYNRLFGNKLPPGSKTLVIDFGGGTLDINVCSVKNNGELYVETSAGDQNFGGNNFDHVMMDLIKKKLYDDCLINDNFYKENQRAPLEERRNRKILLKKLTIESERAKIALSRTKNYHVELLDLLCIKGKIMVEEINDIDELNTYDISITREEFEKVCEKEKLYERLENNINKVMNKVINRRKYTPNDFTIVLSIGGSSKIPKIQEILKKKFGDKLIQCDESIFDPLTAVCKGACFFSEQYISMGKENQLITKLYRSVGIEYGNGKFLPICKEGDDLPSRRETIVRLAHPNQQFCKFHLYQGDDEYVSSPEMRIIGSFTIEQIPQRNSNECLSLCVEMNIEQSGIVRILAKAISETGEQKVIGTYLQTNVDLSPISEKFQEVYNHFKYFKPNLKSSFQISE